jgi:hypothetical protein
MIVGILDLAYSQVRQLLRPLAPERILKVAVKREPVGMQRISLQNVCDRQQENVLVRTRRTLMNSRAKLINLLK